MILTKPHYSPPQTHTVPVPTASVLRWCYTGRFATTIFSVTQSWHAGTMLWPFETMSQQYCNAVLRYKSLVRIVACNVTFGEGWLCILYGATFNFAVSSLQPSSSSLSSLSSSSFYLLFTKIIDVWYSFVEASSTPGKVGCLDPHLLWPTYWRNKKGTYWFFLGGKGLLPVTSSSSHPLEQRGPGDEKERNLGIEFGYFFFCCLTKGLFTWSWGNPDEWGNPLRWGNLPVHIISHFNLITFTW